jgi:hypothetical protein
VLSESCEQIFVKREQGDACQSHTMLYGVYRSFFLSLSLSLIPYFS